jgi:hypothetical protein
LTSCVHMPVSSSGNMKGLSVSDMSNMSASILRRLMWGRAREQFCTLSRVLHVCHEVIDELMINLQAFCGLAAFSVRVSKKSGYDFRVGRKIRNCSDTSLVIGLPGSLAVCCAAF